jgi:hypothetical protein
MVSEVKIRVYSLVVVSRNGLVMDLQPPAKNRKEMLYSVRNAHLKVSVIWSSPHFCPLVLMPLDLPRSCKFRMRERDAMR